MIIYNVKNGTRQKSHHQKDEEKEDQKRQEETEEGQVQNPKRHHYKYQCRKIRSRPKTQTAKDRQRIRRTYDQYEGATWQGQFIEQLPTG